MASSAIIDIDALIQPISDDAPQGSDIREDRSPTSDYYSIKDARNGARAAERANMFDDDESVDTLSMWKPVLDIAPKILSETSKDLEVLSWYIEALIRFHGFAGLRDGLSLTRKIVDTYWDNLYPEPDEDGMETKVAPLTGLNGDGGEGTLLAPIRNCVITTESSDGEFSYWQYQQARDVDKIADPDEKASRFNAMGFTFGSIQSAINSGNAAFYSDLIDDLQVCNDEFLALNDFLLANCDGEAPPTTNIRELLEEVLRALRFLTKDKLAEASAAEETTQEAGSAEATTADAPAGTTMVAAVAGTQGPIAGREDALKRLQEVAKYFRTHEPHTPLAPALERIVSWGRMSVAELMMELVPDANARAMMTQLTGVKLDGSDNETYTPPPVPTPAAAPAEAATPEPAPQENEVSW